MVPDHQAPPFTPQHPPLNSPPLPPCEQQQQPFGAPPGYDSPYRELINDAHHTAYVSNTPHGKIFLFYYKGSQMLQVLQS